MFVKNLVAVCLPNIIVGISHDSTTLYNGAIADTPFYLLNEKVLEISIFGLNLVVKI